MLTTTNPNLAAQLAEFADPIAAAGELERQPRQQQKMVIAGDPPEPEFPPRDDKGRFTPYLTQDECRGANITYSEGDRRPAGCAGPDRLCIWPKCNSAYYAHDGGKQIDEWPSATPAERLAASLRMVRLAHQTCTAWGMASTAVDLEQVETLLESIARTPAGPASLATGKIMVAQDADGS